MKDLKHYATCARIFEYPDAHYPQTVDEVIKSVNTYPKFVDNMKVFFSLLPSNDLVGMQELFIRSFDVQAITTLDIGYVLFGDDYKRGELLSNLNREHVNHHNPCGSELADHLPNVLRLLPLLKDEDLVDELVQNILAPSLKIMISEFEPERMEAKNKTYKKHYKTLIETPVAVKDDSVMLYRHALTALLEMLKQDFTITEQPTLEATSDFLKSITLENELEEKETHGSFK